MPYACLRGEVRDAVGPKTRHQRTEPLVVGDVELFEGEARMRRKLCQTGALQADIIVRVEIVEPMNDRPGGKQAGG
jgi:hypothetical protein